MSKALAIAEPERMPVVYTQAVAALAECCNLDEAKTFSDASEALSVWARVYKHDEAGRQAKQLRLHAHRRMGQLARQLAQGAPKKGGGRNPGPVAKLKEHGLTRHQADAANHLAKMSKGEFDTVVNQDVPPAPTSVVRRIRRPHEMSMFQSLRERPRTPLSCAVFIQNNDPAELAKLMSADEKRVASAQVRKLIDWLTEFDRALSKRVC
jgi:hypothetical protein